jgi:Holliday junction resolvase-like predicted endonuclease
MQIIKAMGQREEFSEKKLHASIQRAGIPEDMHDEVVAHVESKLYENIPTSEIYHHIKEFLSSSKLPYARAKYSLKQAIMEFGPTGYPFEDFIARIFVAQGYTDVKTRSIIPGKCITHEIDVIATKDSKTIMVEAKFHNRVGVHTDSHVAMYSKARFDDIQVKNKFDEVWLMTNTKATIDAIAYAECEQMKIISWSYPEGQGLRELIERYQLHPITALTTLSQFEKQQLVRQGLVLCQDLCKKQPIFDALGLPEEKRFHVLKEAAFACNLHKI